MTDTDPLRPAAIRALVKWLTGQSDVGVVKRGAPPDGRVLYYVAYLQLDHVLLVKDEDGLWTGAGSGPTAEGMTWLEMRSAELDNGYTQLARSLFPDLVEIEMHCEVLHRLPDGTKIRRWASNAGGVMTRSRPLDQADPHFLPDDPQQFELIWSFIQGEQHFRFIGSDRTSGIMLQQGEAWPREDF